VAKTMPVKSEGDTKALAEYTRASRLLTTSLGPKRLFEARLVSGIGINDGGLFIGYAVYYENRISAG